MAEGSDHINWRIANCEKPRKKKTKTEKIAGSSNNKQTSNEKFVKNSCKSKRKRTTKLLLSINVAELCRSGKEKRGGKGKFLALADAHLEFICLRSSA